MIIPAPLQQITEANKHRLVSAAIAAAVLVLAAYLGYASSPDYLVAVGGLLVTLVLFRRPELGMVALLIAALCVPFSIGTGTETTLHAALFLIPALLALWVAEMFRQQSIRLAPSPTNLPLLLLVVSATISLIVGNLPLNYFANFASLPAQLGGWAIFVLSAGVFLLMGHQIKQEIWLQGIVAIFLGLGTLVALGRMFAPFAVVSSALVVDRAQGSLFWVWLVALAGGQALFNARLSIGWRAALGGLGLVCLGVGWFLARPWASGWLPEMIVLFALITLRSWRAGVLLGLVTLGGIFMNPELIQRIVTADQYSLDTRVVAAQIILGQVIQANPILGLGPANYYHYTPLYPILGFAVRFNSHNQYVDIVAQLGIVGLAVFVWLTGSIARLGWGLRERVGNGFARGYVNGCLGGLAGSLAAGFLGDWFLPFVYNIGLAGFRASMLGWLFLGGLVAIKCMLDERALHSTG